MLLEITAGSRAEERELAMVSPEQGLDKCG